MEAISRILIPVMWLAWVAYWVVAARGTKQTQRSENARSRLTYHLPLIVGALFIAVPHILGPQLENLFVPRTPAWLALAIAMVGLGLGFSAAARVWLGRNWSSMVTVKQGHELIRSGPYALVRHPIYTGMLLALIGTVLMVGQWRALIGLAIMLFSFLRKLGIEERFMAQEFGDDYARYRAQVAMLVPFLV